MTFRASTAVLTAIILVVLIPTVHLLLRVNEVSSWLVHSGFSQHASHGQHAYPHRINLDHDRELKYHLGNISYFTPTHYPMATFPIPHFSSVSSDLTSGYRPVTVIRVPAGQAILNASHVRDVIQHDLDVDDVLTPNWLETIIILPDLTCELEVAPESPLLDWDVLDMLHRRFGVKRVHIDPTFYLPREIHLAGLGVEINILSPPALISGDLNGPYLVSVNTIENQIELFPVYRLYPDTFRTFLYGVYNPKGRSDRSGNSYLPLRLVDKDGYNLIPVPSRLYATGKPNGIHGERIGVKDIYDIKGVRTDAGSRAYGELYGVAKSSADPILQLEALDGVTVGKLKTATFAEGSEGNRDTVDEQYPFSARGDGWQTCGGSSSGSACAMGAYDWLDFAVGSDTGGSVRGPAAIVGLYGNRPTTGAISKAGVFPLSEYSDTAGILARDPVKFGHFIRSWYRHSKLNLTSSSRLPKTLLFATDYSSQANRAAQDIVNNFVNGIREKLDMKVEYILLDAELAKRDYSPERVKTVKRHEWDAAQWWTWNKNGKLFYNDYAELHDGRIPVVDPIIRGEWEFARTTMNRSIYDSYIEEIEEFGTLFNKEFLRSDNETCSGKILITSVGPGGSPLYRETELNEVKFQRNTTLNPQAFCPMASCVDYTIPIGQVPYLSKVSKVEEMKAVTINLIAHPGCDFMLLDFVDRLAEVGLVGPVRTGREAF